MLSLLVKMLIKILPRIRPRNILLSANLHPFYLSIIRLIINLPNCTGLYPVFCNLVQNPLQTSLLFASFSLISQSYYFISGKIWLALLWLQLFLVRLDWLLWYHHYHFLFQSIPFIISGIDFQLNHQYLREFSFCLFKKNQDICLIPCFWPHSHGSCLPPRSLSAGCPSRLQARDCSPWQGSQWQLGEGLCLFLTSFSVTPWMPGSWLRPSLMFSWFWALPNSFQYYFQSLSDPY